MTEKEERDTYMTTATTHTMRGMRPDLQNRIDMLAADLHDESQRLRAIATELQMVKAELVSPHCEALPDNHLVERQLLIDEYTRLREQRNDRKEDLKVWQAKVTAKENEINDHIRAHEQAACS